MSERQSRWLLVLVLAGQLILLSSQVPGAGREQTLLETWSLRAVSPFARLVEATSRGLSEVREGFRTRSELEEANQALRTRVDQLEEERVHLFGLRERLERLDRALLYEPPTGGRVRVADVVHVDYGTWFQALILYVGKQGARLEQPVVTADGLLGRVVVVAGPFAKVQIVTDRAASVGAMIERTRRQGVTRGGPDGTLEMDFVPLQADVKVGDRVLTAGIDGVYPRGIPIGHVVAVEPGNELFHRIQLAPAVDLGRLDQVFLLEHETPPASLVREPDAQP